MSRELVLWLLLSACAYRATRLIIRDTFPPVLWVRDLLAGGWRKPTDAEWRKIRNPKNPVPPLTTEVDGQTNIWVERAKWSPDWLAELITCPWCASAYVSGGLVLITDCAVGVQWPWLMGGAVWAGASLIASRTTA